MLGLLSNLIPPSKFTAVAPSDSTDLSAIATKGLYVAVTGTVYVQGVGNLSIVLLGTFSAGTFIPGRFKFVGASTGATVVAVGS